jgi:hypothetical protein
MPYCLVSSIRLFTRESLRLRVRSPLCAAISFDDVSNSEKTRIAQHISHPSRSYAFVEFRSQRHAEDAYYDMYVSLIPAPW